MMRHETIKQQGNSIIKVEEEIKQGIPQRTCFFFQFLQFSVIFFFVHNHLFSFTVCSTEIFSLHGPQNCRV